MPEKCRLALKWLWTPSTASSTPRVIRYLDRVAGLIDKHLVDQMYATGVKVADEQIEALNIEFHDVCPKWNYTIRPR